MMCDDPCHDAADRRGLVTPNSPSQLSLDPLGFRGGPRASHMNVRGWRQSNASGIGILAALFNPSLDFGEIPDDAAGSQIETTGELTALFHLVDSRVGERHQQSEFVATDRSSRAIPYPWRCGTFAWMCFVKLAVGQVDSWFDTVSRDLKRLAELAFGDISHGRSPMTGG